MRVVFSALSQRRLHEIQAYIAYDNIRAALRVLDRIIYAAELLGDYPEIGPIWKGGPTRAFSVTGLPYRIHYVFDPVTDQVEIITVAHTSQMPPDLGQIPE